MEKLPGVRLDADFSRVCRKPESQTHHVVYSLPAVEPEESRDVIVHRFTAVDALTGSPLGERWSVWLGDESHGSFDNAADALDVALALAAETGRSAWLHEEGRPPIEL